MQPYIGKEIYKLTVTIVLFCYRSGLLGVTELLLMPLQHSDLVAAAGSRWINAKPSKYAKYIAHFLNKCSK